MGNGQKREYPVLFWPKTNVPENNSGRECCWPYLIGQHPLSPVFGQKRPGAPGNSYFAQLPPVFGHFMFLSGGLFDYSNSAQVMWRLAIFSHFSVNIFGSSQLYPCLSGGDSISRSCITPARTTTRTSTVRQGDA